MQRRNFLTKILLAIPFVGLAIASIMKGSKLKTAPGDPYALAMERVTLGWTPKQVDDFIRRHGSLPTTLTKEEWAKYKEECIHLPNWQNGRSHIISRANDGTIQATHSREELASERPGFIHPVDLKQRFSEWYRVHQQVLDRLHRTV